MLKLKTFSIFMLFAIGLKAQLQPSLVKHVDVYKSADSIKQNLYKQGIDSVILFYRAWAYNLPRNHDNNEEAKAALILWINKGKLLAQRVSEYAVYFPEREFLAGSEFGKLFRYYLINRKEIDSKPIQFEPRSASDKPKSFLRLIATEDNFSVLEYRINKTSRLSYWLTPMIFYESRDSEFELLNLKAYTWAAMIESELRSQLNSYWKPDNAKLEQVEETAEFAADISGYLKTYQEQAADFKLYHNYQRQEFFLPDNFKGAFSVVQKIECGKALIIEDSVRRIVVPSTGVLALNKYFMSYMQEFFSDSERIKTSIFAGEKNELLPLLETDEKNRNVFGMYPLGDSSYTLNDKRYTVIVFYVGTFAEIEKMGRKKIVEEQVNKSKVECK